MAYSELLVRPMREELSRLGVEEWRTAEEVRDALSDPDGTTLIVINSVCGCAARNARPAVSLALDNDKRPERAATVFAGQDVEATQEVRDHLHGYPPSSPSIALLKEGDVVLMLERHRIEGRTAEEIAEELRNAFEQHC